MRIYQMSARGRGGRGGRVAVSKSLNREQLASLGIGSKELIPGPVLQPPLLYPILERRPVPVNKALCIAILAVSANSDPHGHIVYAPSHDDYQPTDYSYSYGVKDYHTGDVKDQWEKKDGDKVTGHYSLVEPDGSIRTVEYTADKHSGFNAVVKHSGSFKHPVQEKEEPISHNEIILIPKNKVNKFEGNYKEPEYHYQYPEAEGLKYESEVNSYQGGQEGNGQNGQANYIYVPQEETVEESQHSNVKSKYNYKNPSPNIIRPQITIKEEYEKILPPLDLSTIKNSPIDSYDVNLEQAKPQQVYKNDYSPKDTSLQPSHELTQEEINKFLDDYYKNKQVPIELDAEDSFNPIRSKPKDAITQPIPGTFKSNKKPVTTPGLSTYSSGNPSNQYRGYGQQNKHRRNPKTEQNLQKQVVQLPVFHYYIPQDGLIREQRHTEVSSLYRSLPNSGYFRYAKHVKYEE